MHVCVCVNQCGCVMYMHTRAHKPAYTHPHACTYICTHAHNTHTHTHTHTRTHAHTHTRTHAHTHTHPHIYKHAHTRSHTRQSTYTLVWMQTCTTCHKHIYVQIDAFWHQGIIRLHKYSRTHICTSASSYVTCSYATAPPSPPLSPPIPTPPLLFPHQCWKKRPTPSKSKVVIK